jgi:hypothetical protein
MEDKMASKIRTVNLGDLEVLEVRHEKVVVLRVMIGEDQYGDPEINLEMPSGKGGYRWDFEAGNKIAGLLNGCANEKARIRCGIHNCVYHAPAEYGNFCAESRCRNELELVWIWPNDISKLVGADISNMSDDRIIAVVNDDGSVPTYAEAIKGRSQKGR